MLHSQELAAEGIFVFNLAHTEAAGLFSPASGRPRIRETRSGYTATIDPLLTLETADWGYGIESGLGWTANMSSMLKADMLLGLPVCFEYA